jgi:hypothetical protein
MSKTKGKGDKKKLPIPILIIISSIVFISLCASVAVVTVTASITEGEAEGISKNATEAADLLAKHPDAFSVISEGVFNLTPCWVVDWWTNEQLERGLQYPNVRVWIDKEDGSILRSGVPRGKEEVKYPIPSPVPSKDLFPAFTLTLISIIVIAAVIVIIAAVVIRKRRS